jgi:hypothetical protein
MFSRGSPQVRQSAGKKTEKRLSAARAAQIRAGEGRSKSEVGCSKSEGGRSGFWESGVSETILGPATVTLAWLARVRSSLLLKTASSCSRWQSAARGQFAPPSQYNGDGDR